MSGNIRPTITWTNSDIPIYQPYGTTVIPNNLTISSLTTKDLNVTSGVIGLTPGRFISTVGSELYYWDGTELEQLTSVSSISSLGEWALEPAISDVNMDGNSLINANYVESAFLSTLVIDAFSTATVLLDAQSANISSLHVYDLVAENVTVLSTINTINYLSSSSIFANSANINLLSAGNAYVGNLTGNSANFNSISSGNIVISGFNTSSITALNGYIEHLSANTAVINALQVSSINGSEFTSNAVFVSTITASDIISQNISSATASFTQALLSTMSFNPSFSGNLGPNINVDMGMGDFVGSVLGGLIGVGVTVPAGIFAIIGGLVSLIAPRPINNINNNVYEQINMTTQLQVSTLGEQFSTIFRGLSSTVSTISGVPETVNFEVFTSTISSPPPVVAMRSVGDPLQLVSTPWTEYQAFSQWVEIPAGGATVGSNLNLSTLTLLQSTILRSDPGPGGILQVLEAQAPTSYGQVEAQSYFMGASIGGSNGILYYRDLDDRPGFLDNSATAHTLAYTSDIPAVQNLSAVLTVGNSAGGNSIDMNGNDISSINTLFTTNIRPNTNIGNNIFLNAPDGVVDIEGVRMSNTTISAFSGDLFINAPLGVQVEDLTISGTTITAITGNMNIVASSGNVNVEGFNLIDTGGGGTINRAVNQNINITTSGIGTLGLQTGNANLVIQSGSSSSTAVNVIANGGIALTASGSDIGLTQNGGGNISLNTIGAGKIFGNTNSVALTTTTTTTTTPDFSITNTATTTLPVVEEIYKNKPTAGLTGEILFSQRVFGKDSGNTKQQYTQITHSIRNPASGFEDGAINFECSVNGSIQPILQVNGTDTPNGEVNIFRPLDFVITPSLLPSYATVKVSGSDATNLFLDATGSSGNGGISLATKDGVAGAGTGLILTGNTLLSGSAGGTSGQHLCLTIGGVVYKIALLDA